jgi:hypothetical protein
MARRADDRANLFQTAAARGIAMTTPLDIFLQIWAERIPPDVLPYIEAVNNPFDTSTAPDEWGAVVVQNDQRTDVTLGSQPWVEETGTFLIGLFTRKHAGPKMLDAQVNYIRQTFHGARRDGLVIVQVYGPHDVEPQGEGQWWQVAMTAHYTFQTRRDAGSDPLYGRWQGFPQSPPPPLPRPP